MAVQSLFPSVVSHNKAKQTKKGFQSDGKASRPRASNDQRFPCPALSMYTNEHPYMMSNVPFENGCK